ncbi:MAG: hypothetical protein KY443_01460 [Actinobacteria bacterium]|nr:hypothetical protein [Actinomycetota bacterium]
MLLAGFAMLSTNTAYAAPGAGAAVVQGSGTISPGLTLLPAVQPTIAFGGTATGAFANSAPAADVGSVSCSFSGSSNTTVGDNYAVGFGTVSGSCAGSGTVTGAAISVSCSAMTYVRVATIVLVVSATCSVTVGGTTSSGAVVGAFNFIPSTVLPPGAPVTAYELTGVAAFGGV